MKILAIIFLLALAACGHPPKNIGVPESTPPPKAEPLVNPTPPPPFSKSTAENVVQGWPAGTEEYIDSVLPPGFMQLPNTQMAKVCPEWNKLPEVQRRKFFHDILYSIAMAESRHDGKTMYQEAGASYRDGITGKRMYSEGYFQLSYADIQGYGEDCNFGYLSQKVQFLEDTNNGSKLGSFKAKNVRVIHKLGPGIKCSVAIINKRLKTGEEFSAALGRYWSTMQRGGSGYTRTWKAMRSRGTPCS